jgi:hypothetical protein
MPQVVDEHAEPTRIETPDEAGFFVRSRTAAFDPEETFAPMPLSVGFAAKDIR